jgi:hypothetical protein
MLSCGALLATEDSPQANACPLSDFKPDTFQVDKDKPGVPFIDEDQDLKELGTSVVVDDFFTTPDTLYNFMKLVYQRIENALAIYRKEKGLEEGSIFLLFKGGNVLRMVANEIFALLPPKARKLLDKEYSQYFKRSDADFSVYVDENKLNNNDYEKVFKEVNELVFAELGKIREEFQKDPSKYFNFMQLDNKYSMKELNKYFKQLPSLAAISDKDNSAWYKAKFSQLQFRDATATSSPICFYKGQYDYKYEDKNGKIQATPMSDKPHWIANTDNRTLQWSWGSDPNKIIKFYLVRSKIIFEYTFEKDNELKRRPIGGELIDVSLPHRDDARLRKFLDNFDNYVSEYTLISDKTDDKFTMKSYSPAYLVKDLQFIIFDSYERPWKGGPKYIKRLSRIFFLFIAEMINSYGLGSRNAKSYVDTVQKKILEPLHALYPIKEKKSVELVKTVINNAEQIASVYKKMRLSNDFWLNLGDFIQKRLIKNPQEDDEAGFKEFLEAMENNMNIAHQLADMPEYKIDMSKIFEVRLKHLF